MKPMIVAVSKTLPNALTLRPAPRRVRDERHLTKRNSVLTETEIEARQDAVVALVAAAQILYSRKSRAERDAIAATLRETAARRAATFLADSAR